VKKAADPEEAKRDDAVAYMEQVEQPKDASATEKAQAAPAKNATQPAKEQKVPAAPAEKENQASIALGSLATSGDDSTEFDYITSQSDFESLYLQLENKRAVSEPIQRSE